MSSLVEKLLAFSGTVRIAYLHNIQIVLAQNFPRAKWLSCISLDRKFHSASNGMCPLSLSQKKVGENCRKLTVTLQHVSYRSLRMRNSVANLILFFVIVTKDLITHEV